MRSVSGTQGSGGVAGIGNTAGAASPSGGPASGDGGFGAILTATVADSHGVGDRPGASNEDNAGNHRDGGATSDQGDTASSLAALLDVLPAKAGLDQPMATVPAPAGDGTTVSVTANNNSKDAHPSDGKRPTSDGAAQDVTLTGALLVAAPVAIAPAAKGDTAAMLQGQVDGNATSGIDPQRAASLGMSAAVPSRSLPGAAGADDTAAETRSSGAAQSSEVAAEAAVSSGTQANPEAELTNVRAVADMSAPSPGSTKKILETRHAAASALAVKTGAESVAQTPGTPGTDQDAEQAAARMPAVVSAAGVGTTMKRDPAGSGDLPNPPGTHSSVDANNFGASVVGAPSLAASTPASDIPASPTGSPAAPELIGADGVRQPIATAVTTQVLSMLANGHDQVTLHVSPPALGNLTLRVDVQANNVSTWFGSAQPQVQQAVSDAIAQLQNSLSGAGFNLVGAWVGADASAGRGQQPMPQPARKTAGIDALPDSAAARIGDSDSSRVSVYV